MASTNTRLQLPFQLAAQLGQGLQPLIRCRVSYDDVTVAIPSWTEVTHDLGKFSVSHGRDTELGEFDSGTASIELYNRTRSYDPWVNANVRPMNRLWLQEEFDGEVHDLFKGYIEVWDQQWPDGGWSNAIAAVQAADEFKVLNLDTLPTTSPPRGSYSELVQVDNPTGLWELNENPDLNIQPPVDVEPNPGQDRGLLPLFGSNRRRRAWRAKDIR